MTRIVVFLVVLYAVWRVATIMGRKREKQYRATRQGRGWSESGIDVVARCSRCGRYLQPGEVGWEGRWPRRRAVCAGGCPPHDRDDEPES